VGSAFARRIEVEALAKHLPLGGIELATQASEQVDRLAAGELRPQAHIARHVGKPPVKVNRVLPWIRPKHRDLTAVGPEQSEEDSYRRGLAGAVGSEEAMNGASLHLHGEFIERRDRPVGLDKVV